MEDAEVCFHCKRSYSTPKNLLNADTLQQDLEARIKKEEEEHEAEEKRYAEVTRRLEEERIRREKRLKKATKIGTISISCIALVSTAFLLTVKVIIPTAKYNKATKLLNNGSYDEAITAFAELENYKDSVKMVDETKYQQAMSYFSSGSYDEAIALFSEIASYNDAADQINVVTYQKALSYYESGKYDKAISLFREIENYSDSADQINGIIYQQAMSLMKEEKFLEASEIFKSINGYQDAEAKSNECVTLKNEADYQNALRLYNDGNYDDAITAFRMLGAYSNSVDMFNKICYEYANHFMESNYYQNAIKYFQKTGDYLDAKERLKEAFYYYGADFLNNSDYEKAIQYLELCQNYADASSKLMEAKYKLIKSIDLSKGYFRYSTETNLKYMNELIDAGYNDINALKKEIFDWRVEIYFNNSENDTTKISTLSISDNWYCHVELLGGEPHESIQLYYTFYDANGSAKTGQFDKKWKSLYSGTISFSAYNTLSFKTGTIRIVITDDKGNQLGSASVKIE